jgi:hypothetical protein
VESFGGGLRGKGGEGIDQQPLCHDLANIKLFSQGFGFFGIFVYLCRKFARVMMTRKYPIGIQTFPRIRRESSIYVDITPHP